MLRNVFVFIFQFSGRFYKGRIPKPLGCRHFSRTASFCFSLGHAARYARSRKTRTYGTIAENAPQADFAESSFHEIEPQTYEKLFACNDFAPDFVERGRILGDS